MESLPKVVPDHQILARLFYENEEELGDFFEATADHLPAPFRQLLAHDEHMTVANEQFHGGPVSLEALREKVTATHYARTSLLRRPGDGRAIQFGVVRLNFAYLDDPVRRDIEARRIPLGRVLMQHNVLRHVELIALWRIRPEPELLRYLLPHEDGCVYGRTALIYCNGEPALELLEIVSTGDRRNC